MHLQLYMYVVGEVAKICVHCITSNKCIIALRIFVICCRVIEKAFAMVLAFKIY